jgi:hypothetical protein
MYFDVVRSLSFSFPLIPPPGPIEQSYQVLLLKTCFLCVYDHFVFVHAFILDISATQGKTRNLCLSEPGFLCLTL